MKENRSDKTSSHKSCPRLRALKKKKERAFAALLARYALYRVARKMHPTPNASLRNSVLTKSLPSRSVCELSRGDLLQGIQRLERNETTVNERCF